ncbi:MAG TPA: hypothetical protein VJK09_03015 [Candidatus Paceibacterota bacterium]
MESSTNFLLALITVLIGALGYLLKRMFDSVEKLIDRVDLIYRDVSDIRPKVELMWRNYGAVADSPRQLNERGQKILSESGIEEIVNEQEDFLLEEIKKQDIQNPYDAERTVERVMADLPKLRPDLLDKLKLGAYRAGEDTDTVLYIGAIYLRNKVFPALGFPTTDIVDPE